jgi:Uma2 family endonuclease
MKAVLRLPKRATYADYLGAQQNSESRLEYIDGVIVAMAVGSDEHNAIAGRLAGLSFNRL